MQRVEVAVLVALSCWSSRAQASANASAEQGACAFENEPMGVGYFWDEKCELGELGCFADAKNVSCRLCGAGDFVTIDCPPSSCRFHHQPVVPYYWDKDCVAGALGCWADGVHAQCRFCGDYPFTNISCPSDAAESSVAGCAFNTSSDTHSYWEPDCDNGTYGCLADGKNVNCRFCGSDAYTDIPCPASEVCTFANEPSFPYFWDPSCQGNGGLGCKADGIHQECRFCAMRPFEDVPCPEHLAPPNNSCTWPLHGEPVTPSFWDPTCTTGALGCWADGLHASCRFCGTGVFANISCVEAATGNGSHILGNDSGEVQHGNQTPANVSGEAQDAGQLSGNASAETQNASQLQANASSETQNASELPANASGDAQNGSHISTNASAEAQHGSHILENVSGEAQHGSHSSMNAGAETGNESHISAADVANGSMNETTNVSVAENQTVSDSTNPSALTLDENQTNATNANGSAASTPDVTQDENQTNQTNQTDQTSQVNQTDENQTHDKTSVSLRASSAQAYDVKGKKSSAEDGKWWDELSAAVPCSFTFATLITTLSLFM